MCRLPGKTTDFQSLSWATWATEWIPIGAAAEWVAGLEHPGKGHAWPRGLMVIIMWLTGLKKKGVGESLGQTSQRILDKFLNILPTVTIREGHRVKIYLFGDLAVPHLRKP